MTALPLVLIAEPDQAARIGLSRALEQQGYRVVEAGDGPYAVRQAFSTSPDAVILNLSLPLLSGLELVKLLRAASDMAIITVTDSPSSQLAIRVLDSGADDYLPANIPPREIVARIQSALRRVTRQASIAIAATPAYSDSAVVRTGDLEIDLDHYSVRKNGAELQMTRLEHLLLRALARRMGQVAPHRYLMTEVWGSEYLDDTHYLRGYVASLRNKLEADPSRPRLLLTEWGVGYRLEALPVETEVAPTRELVEAASA